MCVVHAVAHFMGVNYRGRPRTRYPKALYGAHPTKHGGVMIRLRVENIGGPFPGKGQAPSMAHDKILPRNERAAFEKLNDLAAMRPHVMDAGSLSPANDNPRPPETPATKSIWPAQELRLTPSQADFLHRGRSSVHKRINDRTELILKSRGMLAWRKGCDDQFYLVPSDKGQAALSKYEQREGRK